VQVPRYRIEAQLGAGQLRVVLADLPPPAIPVSVLYPHQRQLSARVRVFADWLVQLFRQT
jgi:DNA-binding transcriptional LysR family regulator